MVTITRVNVIEALVDELERSHAEAEERMADPSVYNDHRKAAETGRRLKELEGPKKLADAWRQASADLEAARSDPELAGMAAELEADVERLEEELKLALVEKDPADEKDVIVEIRAGAGGEVHPRAVDRHPGRPDPLHPSGGVEALDGDAGLAERAEVVREAALVQLPAELGGEPRVAELARRADQAGVDLVVQALVGGGVADRGDGHHRHRRQQRQRDREADPEGHGPRSV